MKTKQSPLRIYKEKMAEVHTPEEIKAAFEESSYAVCFGCDRGYIAAKHELFAAIWQVNPDVIITKADLCILAEKPVVWRDQLLLINRNGTMEMVNQFAGFMAESGIISYEYRFLHEAGADYKICFGSEDAKGKSVARFKGNLLIDGEYSILTVRPISQ